jgi:hypothetical protein
LAVYLVGVAGRHGPAPGLPDGCMVVCHKRLKAVEKDAP